MNTTGAFLFRATMFSLFLALSASAVTNYTVIVNSDFFSPRDLTIGQGDTVLWTNAASVTHTSTSGNTNNCTTATSFWGSGNILPHTTFSVTFTNFTAGAYPYLCTIHCGFNMKASLTITNAVVVNLPPTVALTNPPTGARFPAPAGFVLQASASDADGSVTNVQFFSGANALGNVAAAPYHFSVTGLPAGNYAFTAQATDNRGAVSTSAVVNVFVQTNALLTAPARLPNGQFRFTIHGIAGQTYATEASSNLTGWSALGTNLAPTDVFDVTDATATNVLLRFYRARQDL